MVGRLPLKKEKKVLPTFAAHVGGGEGGNNVCTTSTSVKCTYNFEGGLFSLFLWVVYFIIFVGQFHP